MAEYSYLVLYIPRGISRDAARRMLTDHAEYGNWELSRLRLFADGSRKATLRRPIIRQAPWAGLPAWSAGGQDGFMSTVGLTDRLAAADQRRRPPGR